MGLKIIGICGVARVGKDTFCSNIINILDAENIISQRIAFADALKEDMNSFLLAKTGVNAYTTCAQEKEIIRPLLVAYGATMRELTQGKYWIDKVKEKVEENIKNNIISIISDVRYANEVKWINSTENGLTLHLRRKGIKAANQEEEVQDPLASHCCHQRLFLKTYSSPSQRLTQTQKYINELRISEKIIGCRSNSCDSATNAEQPLLTRTSRKT